MILKALIAKPESSPLLLLLLPQLMLPVRLLMLLLEVSSVGGFGGVRNPIISFSSERTRECKALLILINIEYKHAAVAVVVTVVVALDVD